MSKRRRRFWRRVALAVLVALVGGFLYMYFRPPTTAPPSAIKVEMTPERIARGEYLFTALCDCDGCHSERDFTRLGGPVVTRGKGQVMPLKGLPGRIVASNITPDPETGIGQWTDGEKIRAIREGIGRDGRALFPLMPYPNYRLMGDPDVQALVAYMNTLAPVKNPLPKTEIDFPVSMFIKGVPRPVTGRAESVHPSAGAMYGEYVVTLASCEECHTPAKRGQIDPSRRFAGGRLFDTPYGKVASSNISQDNATGIGTWDFGKFQERVRYYRAYADGESPKAGPEKFTLMPWLAYSKLTGPDLEAIFYYVKSRPAISNKVETHPQ